MKLEKAFSIVLFLTSVVMLGTLVYFHRTREARAARLAESCDASRGNIRCLVDAWSLGCYCGEWHDKDSVADDGGSKN